MNLDKQLVIVVLRLMDLKKYVPILNIFGLKLSVFVFELIKVLNTELEMKAVFY